MSRTPAAVWIVDTKKEHIAVDEARKLGIPVIAVLDTNCDPDEVDFPIPGNDDAIRSAALLTRVVADAVADGLIARSGKALRAGSAEAKPEPGTVASDEPLPEWERELLEGSKAEDAARPRSGSPSQASRERSAGPQSRSKDEYERARRREMSNFTAADVKKLRDLTGSGMMDCKKALEEAEGDFDKAVEILRIKGAKDVGKRAVGPLPMAWSPTPARRCWSSTARPTSWPRAQTSSSWRQTLVVSLWTASSRPMLRHCWAAKLPDGRTVAETIEAGLRQDRREARGEPIRGARRLPLRSTCTARARTCRRRWALR